MVLFDGAHILPRFVLTIVKKQAHPDTTRNTIASLCVDVLKPEACVNTTLKRLP